MEARLSDLTSELEAEGTADLPAVARFVHVQILEHARDCLEKSRQKVITSRYFYELTENLEKLLADVSSSTCAFVV